MTQVCKGAKEDYTTYNVLNRFHEPILEQKGKFSYILFELMNEKWIQCSIYLEYKKC